MAPSTTFPLKPLKTLRLCVRPFYHQPQTAFLNRHNQNRIVFDTENLREVKPE